MQTKHLFLTAILLVFSMLVVAAPVDPMRALEVAEQFAPQSAKAKRIKSKTAPEQSYEIVYTHRMPNSDRAAFYVVKLGEKGFVIISADDVANPILGYSYTNSWPTSLSAQGDTLLPPQVLSYLNDMALQIESAIEKYPNLESSDEWNNVGQKAVRKTSARKSADALPDSVGPLLTTTWGQGQYYNALCPEDAGGEDGHVQTGCVATAMAQIINYWGQKEEIKTRGIHSYDSQYGNLTVNYDTTSYDFANMPDALTAESTPEQINAVAKLMYECGVAVNMQYSAWESASLNEDARAALINFYRFSPDLSIAERAYFSSKNWDKLLQSNIANNQPIYYAGQNLFNGGHAFICDGYNAVGYYHFNFGWNGLADGWYLTSAVSPIGMDFSSNQLVLVGIAPNNMSNVILGQTTGTSTFTVDKPFEFYHLFGHNAYVGTNYMNECNNHVLFLSADDATQLVLDILEHEDQNAIIYDGEWGTELRSLYAGQENDLSSIVSTNNALQINYLGNLYYSGFHFAISRDEGCRRVSNIVTSVDTTTIHLMWQENGNATQWEIEYGEKGFALGSGTKVVVDATQYDLIGLKKLTEYDIYIRPVCGSTEYNQWRKITVLSLAAYWTDIVTEEPTGYVVSEDRQSVEIYTPKAFAWWAKQECSIDAYLMADLDMSAYRWKPAILYDKTIFGNKHEISGIYAIESTVEVGLFGALYFGTIDNLGVVNSHIKGSSQRVGGLCGVAHSGKVRNCYVQNSIITGNTQTGGLIGCNSSCAVLNSYANTHVSGENQIGLLIGNLNSGVIQNCYAAGSLRQTLYCSSGGIVGYSNFGRIENCYSVKTLGGVVGHKGTSYIADTSTIIQQYSELTLQTPIRFDTEIITTLLLALNHGVSHINNSSLCVWQDDINGINDGYPILGKFCEVTCPNVTDVSFENVIVNGKNAIIVSWDGSDADLAILRYRRRDKPTEPYAYIDLTGKVDTIYGIPLGYAYDFNVRAVCDSDQMSGWSSTQSFIVDLPYWTDVVTTQPEGYKEDAYGNIYISSAEGLAWLSSKANGLIDGCRETFINKNVILTKNISLEGLRWFPIGTTACRFLGNFNGNGYSIAGVNVCENLSSVGLFGAVGDGSIMNVNIISGKIKNLSQDGSAGGLIGSIFNNERLINCHSSADVYGVDGVGSLFGSIHSYEKHTIITDCSASGSVTGARACGGLIGDAFGVEVSNCYATGTVYNADSTWYSLHRGGLIGYFAFSSIYNCFSIGEVNFIESNYVGGVIGCPEYNPHIHYIYGQKGSNKGLELIGYDCEDISDTAQFVHNGNKNSLTLPISINGTTHTDLIDALNAWVKKQNNPTFRTWVTDSITGYPVFGEHFVPSCYNPTNLSVANATLIGDSIIRTQLSWQQEGEPIAWEILYVNTEQKIENGTIIQVNTNPCILSDIPVGKPLDFYVRAICNEDDISSWSEPITYIPDKLRWTEVVTTQPEGYKEDEYGNIYISSAEGLAWLSSKANGLNGQEMHSLNEKRIYVTKDLDISQYKWTPLGVSHENPAQKITIYGNNHNIKGLYINELTSYVGFFGATTGLSVFNLSFKDCNVLGKSNVGTIAGYGLETKVVNCLVTGTISGIEHVGGIIGTHYTNPPYSIANICSNSCFIGDVLCRTDITQINSISGYIGGLVGSSFDGIFTNCYVVVEIPNTISYSGIITGSGGFTELVSNCYYKEYKNSPDITSPSCTRKDNSSFAGNKDAWILSTPSYVNNVFHTDLVNALNAWVDANNSEGQYLHWVADTAGVNGGFPIFADENTTYIITFCNEDGTILQQDTLEFGEMPQYRGEIPEKETEYMKYSFIGWSPSLHPATENITYTAQYTEMYSVSFHNWDGTLLQSTWYNYGEYPKYTGETPTREADAQYTYTFTGWSPELSMVTGTTYYYAQYETTLNQYEINFYDWDGTLLQSSMVNYGEWPTYYNSDPWREADAQYTYTFSGWSPELSMVTSHQSYYAQYESTINQYEITFYDWDGTLLQSTMVNYGEWPTYYNSDPWREADAQYTYSFSGWSPQLDWVSGNQSYYAQYESTLNQYQITFYDWNGIVLQSELVNYGEMPTYTGVTPTREADTQYTYTFTGWSPELSVVTGNQSYTAQYEATLNQYEVTFYNWNGEVLQSTMVDYGAMPEYFGEIPTKPEDEQYVYTFSGWEPEITIVVAYAEYTAQYDATDKVTTVIENTQSDEVKTYKILRNNKIFIIRGDKVYSILGHVIEDWMPLGL